MTTLRGSHLVKTLHKNPLVRDISLQVMTGEAVGLFGANGAGKTTTFLLMAGIMTPDQGRIFWDQKDITSLPLYQRARLGLRYLPQDASVFRGLTVEQNLLAVLDLMEPCKKARQEQLEKLLEDFRLQPLRRSSALVLSGGERRRLEIARCLVGNPRFLLMDEPCAGIDPKSIEDLGQLITNLTQHHGIGVLITDHNVRDTLKMVQRGYVLHEGRILEEGLPQDLAQSPLVREVYLGEGFSSS